MLYMIGDKIVEITRTDMRFSWNRVNTPDLSHVPTVKEFLTSVDVSEPHGMVEAYVELVDVNYYQFMSQNEVTDFLYRFSSHSMSAHMDTISKLFGQ